MGEMGEDAAITEAVAEAHHHLSHMPAPAWIGGPWKVVYRLAKALIIQTERLEQSGRTAASP